MPTASAGLRSRNAWSSGGPGKVTKGLCIALEPLHSSALVHEAKIPVNVSAQTFRQRKPSERLQPIVCSHDEHSMHSRYVRPIIDTQRPSVASLLKGSTMDPEHDGHGRGRCPGRGIDVDVETILRLHWGDIWVVMRAYAARTITCCIKGPIPTLTRLWGAETVWWSSACREWHS